MRPSHSVFRTIKHTILHGRRESLCYSKVKNETRQIPRPGANQVIYVGSVGKVYKLDLSGKMLGKLGKLGRLPGWFDSVHALTCPDEKTLYLAEEFSYRFDKVVLQ